MKNNTELISVKYGYENCPADALMNNFRKKVNKKSSYPQNIQFSKNIIDFFREMANIVEESENHIKFRWYEDPVDKLPPLIVKIRKSNGKYYLQYLKELGTDKLIIKGKQRKGKNKNGKIKMYKEEER